MNKQRLFQHFQEYGKPDPGTDETVVTLPGAIGDGCRREIRLGPGLKVYLEQYTLRERMTARVVPEHFPLGISICMSGRLNWTPDSPGPVPTYKTRAGKFDVSLADVNTDDGFIECLPGDPVVLIRLLVAPDRATMLGRAGHECVERITQQPGSGDPSFIYTKKPLSPAMDLPASQMLNCRLAGSGKQLYLTAKALEIISLVMGCLQPEEGPCRQIGARAIPGSGERQVLYRARQLLDDSLAAPPSLAWLAKKTGLNETKLKKGFKHLFGTPISAYLLDQRMQRGKELLRTGQVSVSQAAWQTGYANRAHFTRAFSRQFGYPPSALLRPVKP